MSYLAIITLRDPLHFVSILNKTETYMKKKNEKLSILNGKESANRMQSINLMVYPIVGVVRTIKYFLVALTFNF